MVKSLWDELIWLLPLASVEVDSVEVDIESVTLLEVDVTNFRVLSHEEPRSLDVRRLPSEALHYGPAQVLQVVQSICSKEVLQHLELFFDTLLSRSWVRCGNPTEFFPDFPRSCWQPDQVRDYCLRSILSRADSSREAWASHFIRDVLIREQASVLKEERKHVTSSCELTFTSTRYPLFDIGAQSVPNSLAIGRKSFMMACVVLDPS